MKPDTFLVTLENGCNLRLSIVASYSSNNISSSHLCESIGCRANAMLGFDGVVKHKFFLDIATTIIVSRSEKRVYQFLVEKRVYQSLVELRLL